MVWMGIWLEGVCFKNSIRWLFGNDSELIWRINWYKRIRQRSFHHPFLFSAFDGVSWLIRWIGNVDGAVRVRVRDPLSKKRRCGVIFGSQGGEGRRRKYQPKEKKGRLRAPPSQYIKLGLEDICSNVAPAAISFALVFLDSGTAIGHQRRDKGRHGQQAQLCRCRLVTYYPFGIPPLL